LDFLSEELAEEDWTEIRVVKTMSEVYKGELPCILINIVDRTFTPLEIGGHRNLRYYVVYIRVFGTGDGIREDLDDFLVGKHGIFEHNPDYYEYEIDNGIVINKTLKGKIVIEKILEDKKEFNNTDPNTLEKEDRYRQKISLKCRIALT